MDSISRIAMFLEVVKHQSFAGAAKELGVTGPALSKQVQALEDQLGVRLLHRTTRRVTLTEEGAVFSDKAGKAIEDLEEAKQQVQELKECPTGRLKVSVPLAFGQQYLARSIAGFAKRYPHVNLEVDFDDRYADIIAEGYDLAVRIGRLEDSTLIARHLAACPKFLCVSATYANENKMPSIPDDLTEHPAILYSNLGITAEWFYKSPDGIKGSVKMSRAFSSNNMEMMLEACLQGIGVAQIPAFGASRLIEEGKLVRILPDYETYSERGIYIVFPQNRYISTRVRLFIDWITESCKDCACE